MTFLIIDNPIPDPSFSPITTRLNGSSNNNSLKPFPLSDTSTFMHFPSSSILIQMESFVYLIQFDKILINALVTFSSSTYR